MDFYIKKGNVVFNFFALLFHKNVHLFFNKSACLRQFVPIVFARRAPRRGGGERRQLFT